MSYSPQHTFHIPVMGLAYTIDSPIKVARFGINSVMSIVEDKLIEMMRSHYYPTIGLTYEPINSNEDDYRVKRITDYLNLVNTIVQAQVEKLKKAAFEAGSEIVKYFEMLPDDSTLKHLYRQMIATEDQREKEKMEEILRAEIRPGSIEVNIMTKLDRNSYNEQGQVIENGSEAVTALRGYANSTLSNSSVIFSAGMNPRLYNYIERCEAFEVNAEGKFLKKVVIKVSDYRSALIQGKFLAKKGIWVSEFRVESGLNCGGHAFATDGYLMGPILEEFASHREELIDTLFALYSEAQEKKNNTKCTIPPKMIFSVQGGIGTHAEDDFLHQHYHFDSTGWGTPFLLVPEATTVDEVTLQLLCSAQEKDIVLSNNSPIGVRFHYLKGLSGEKEKQNRIAEGIPGTPCTEKHLALNTEFTTEPICTASHKYQKLKLAQLESLHLPEAAYKKQLKDILDKECLCVGLSNPAAIAYQLPFVKNRHAVNICPGPNIVNFSKVVSLQTMTDHIYGRKNIQTNSNRPHMFIAELYLYIDYLKELLTEDALPDQLSKKKKGFAVFYQNLRNGILYYKQLPSVAIEGKEQFAKDLYYADKELDVLNYRYELSDSN